MWNFSKKEDNLWVKWVHAYYVKEDDVMIVPIKGSCSWMLKNILKHKEDVQVMRQCQELRVSQKSLPKKFYYGLIEKHDQVPWRKVFFDNNVRPHACFILWLVCNDCLATK